MKFSFRACAIIAIGRLILILLTPVRVQRFRALDIFFVLIGKTRDDDVLVITNCIFWATWQVREMACPRANNVGGFVFAAFDPTYQVNVLGFFPP